MNLLLPNFPSKLLKRAVMWRVLALAATLAIASLACGSAAVTDAPPEDEVAETEAPTEEVAPSVAPTRGPNPPPDGWGLTILEEFNEDADEWGIASDHGHDVTVTVSNGVLNWTLESQDASSYRWPAGGPSLSDFMASVDVNQAGGEGTFGLTFRDQGGALYAFKVSYFGEYTLQYGDGDAWEALIDWTETGIEGDTVPHRLAVRGEGDHFILYVNDQQVGEYTDSRLQQGHVGLYIGTYQGTSLVEVQFDNLMVWAP